MLDGVKRLVRNVFSRDTWRAFLLPRSAYDYAKQVGDGTGSSTVAAPLLWMGRNFPEAPPALWPRAEYMQGAGEPDHPMLRLLERPNDFYTGVLLWMATVTDWMVNGDAYWLKLPRKKNGQPDQLWWAPSWMMEPIGSLTDPETFIAYYRYTVDGIPSRVNVEDVVHFRFGMDSDNPRHGVSPLKSVLREVFTDDEAAAFTATLLKNGGVPGVVISPDTDASISLEDAELTKESFMEKFGGDRRGEPMVMTSRTKVSQFGFSPEQLNLRELRRIPEERVTAVMGIPAIVAGLGAGLDRSTFTNMAEAREAAYESGIIPVQRILAEDVRWQLLGDFVSDPFQWRFGFDLSKVRVLQEDDYRKAQRHDLAVRGGWEMVAEARKATGLPVDEARDNVFLRAANMNVMRATAFTGGSAPATGARAGNGNGNGHVDTSAIAQEVVREIERERLLTGRGN